jgi:hypothetical protein
MEENYSALVRWYKIKIVFVTKHSIDRQLA